MLDDERKFGGLLKEAPRSAGASAVHDVVLLGRRVAVAVTKDGPRAIAKGELPNRIIERIVGKEIRGGSVC